MANNPYANFVLENKIEDLLTTHVDMNNFLHADQSLTEAAGMRKTIHKYSASGAVEAVAMGADNQDGNIFEASYVSNDYDVAVFQAKGRYYDEEAMKDPMIVDSIVQGMGEAMVNHFTSQAIGEMKKSDLIVECDFTTSTTGYFFGKVVDALALLGEDQQNYSMLISPSQQAYIRKQLADDLKYSGDFARTGYIGSVCGVPVIVSAAVPEGCCFIVNREAITLFIKKGVEIEQEREAGTRKNLLFARKVNVVALTNAKKLVELAKAQSTACAITTYLKTGKTIAGTCGSDCHKVVVNYDGVNYSAVASNGSWTIDMAANLTAGKKINATAYAYGKAPKAATEVTVAS